MKKCEICKRVVGGLNQINTFVSDSEVNALAGGLATADLITLLTTTKASPAVRHHDDYKGCLAGCGSDPGRV
ncbi:MAG: hypothetical protein U0Y68_20875 [Blastocatellia bacterium]